MSRTSRLSRPHLNTAVFWGASLLGTVSAHALSLDEYLKLVRERNGLYESTALAKEAAEARIDQGDLVLSPYLSLGVSRVDDKKPQAVPAFQGTRTQATVYDFGLAKKFATGTAFSVAYNQSHANVTGATLPVDSAWAGTLTLGLSQSLWRDGFGRGTRIRHARETATARLEKLGQESQARQVLASAEAAFWDFIYEKEEVKVRRESLARSDRLMSWTNERLDKGIADRSDFLQSQALQSSRKIQLLSAEDDYKAALRRLADQAKSPDDANFAQVSGDHDSERSPRMLVGVDEPARIDSLVKALEADVREKAAEEVSETLRPDLALQASYATNARDPSYSAISSDVFDTSKPTLAVGLKFSMDLDRGAVNRVRAGQRADARAARLRAEQAWLESRTAWTELVRRHAVLGERIRIMSQLVSVNADKVKRENDRLRLGRTTTFQVINFEQDLAEAQITLLKLKVEQRKLEAQTRLFVNQDATEKL